MIPSCPDYSTACIAFHGLIAERYPDDPEVMDHLTVKVIPCQHQGSARKGHVIIAWPKAEGAKDDNLLVVYFGG